jgi:hypothetical protein
MTSFGRATHRPATKMFRRTTAMLKKPKVIANTPTPPARVNEIADRVAIMSATNNYKYTGRREMKEFHMQWLISQMRNCDFLPCFAFSGWIILVSAALLLLSKDAFSE